MMRFLNGIPSRVTILIIAALLLSCGGTTTRSAVWISSSGSESIPVVYNESPGAAREIVLTTDIPGVDVPMIREEINAYGRMIVSASLSNDSRSQQMAEVKAKFFDYSGKVLEAASDWEAVFLQPNQITKVDITCLRDGAVSFKLIIR